MILMMSRTDMLQEYLLPSSDGMDHQILLPKESYGLKHDLLIQLENTGGQWYVKESSDYRIDKAEPGFGRIPLMNEFTLCFITRDNEKLKGISVEGKKDLLSFVKYDISANNTITIGNQAGKNISYAFMKYVSQNHATLTRRGSGWILEDTSANGTFVNGRKASRSYELRFGDEINAFGLRMVYLGNILAVGSHYGKMAITGMRPMVIPEAGEFRAVKGETRTYFHRSPRNMPLIHRETVQIEAPPEPRIAKRRPLLMQIGPSFTMAIPMLLGCLLSMYAAKARGSASGAFMYTGLVTAVGSALIGSVWALMNIRSDRRDELENENTRFNEYGEYLMKISDDLREKYGENRNAMFAMYPSPADNCLKNGSSADLWNRNMTHDDFMYYRVGIGNIPFQVHIDAPQERFTLNKDFLKDKVRTLASNYETMEDVPIGIDLFKHRLCGIIGGKNKGGAISLMYSIVSGIAACNCYTDVKMVFLYSEDDDPEQWEFMKWFPHVWSENRRTRYVACNSNDRSDVLYELVNIMRQRDDVIEHKDNVIPKPQYVVFVSDPRLLENQLIAKYIYHNQKQYGMTALIMAERYEELPNECEFILENTAVFQGYYETTNIAEKTPVHFDTVTAGEVSALAKNLSELQVQEIESDTEIPSSLDFFEMYGVDSMEKLNILEQWYKNRNYNSMRALIGRKAGGADCYLDIHEKFHGPHGLVAGTTGSGKSEILQTYILSLAINFSPDDVAFFIIDFKGGGMSNLFTDLPHMAGEISNLSGNQVRRAMISIKSENRRRQRIFSEYGVNNINLYTRLYKSHEAKIPIPHLIIIIDEFAELKREEPEFMKELISVAQVGRSLGVHLILATQKPSGTVDDNIRSNSKFHLCLRVQDRQDSNDMLHKPDAAYITQAGRCYLQVGNDEIFELFQSGYSGAVFDKNMGEKNENIATMITLTGRPAIYGSRTKMKRREKEKISWYDTIIRRIEYVRGESYDGRSIAELEPEELEDLTETVYRLLVLKNDYEMSSSHLGAVRNFVRLYAQGKITDGASVVNGSFVGIKLPEVKERTQLDVLVKYIKSVAESSGFRYKMQLWLPVLPEKLIYSSLAKETPDRFDGKAYGPLQGRDFSLKATLGLYDDPENQLQLPVTIDFAENGNLALCAAVSTGKSTFMQTLVYSLAVNYTPEELNMYILDFSSHRLNCYTSLPHVGGVMNENDTDKISKFFMMTERIMKNRQQELGGGSYGEYVRAYGRKLPAIVIVIDNFGTFKEKTASEYESILMRISRDGQSVGIYLALSAGGFSMNEISSRMSENIKTVICLEMGDKFKYMDVLRQGRISVLPEADVRGRGLVKTDDRVLEFQTAIAVDGEDDYERTEKLVEFSRRLSDLWTGRRAAEIPCIPDKPTLADLSRTDGYSEALTGRRYIPIGYTESDASLECIDLSSTFLYTFSGRKRTGKTNAMKIAIELAAEKDGTIYIIEKDKNELKALAGQVGAKYIESCQGIYDFLTEIKAPFIERNKFKHTLVDKGLEDSTMFTEMQKFKPVFVFIASLEEFLNMVYHPEEGIGQMKGFVENIMDKGDLHNFWFFACMDPDNNTSMLAYPAYKRYMDRKQGMHLGGCLDRQKQFTATNISYADQSKSMPRGTAMTPYKDDDTRMYKVIVPLAGGEAR